MSVISAIAPAGTEPPEPPARLGVRIKARRDGSDPIATLVATDPEGRPIELELTLHEVDMLGCDLAEARICLTRLARADPDDDVVADGNVLTFRRRA